MFRGPAAFQYATLAYIVHTLDIETVEKCDPADIYDNARTSMMARSDNVANLGFYASCFIALATVPSSRDLQIAVPESYHQICFNDIFGCVAVGKAVHNRDYRPRRRDNIPAPWYFVRSSLITIYLD